MPPRKILLLGDVITDILVEPSAPIVAGQDNLAAIQARPGGSAANQAAWLGWCSAGTRLRRAGAPCGLEVTFIGRVGAADVEFHRAELARFGVQAYLAADESAPTGSIVVLVRADGERTFITDRGANLRLSAADVPAGLLDGAALLHLTGYSLFEPGPRAVALSLIAQARSRGIPFSVDPGSAAFLARLEPGEFLRWTAGAAICFPNRDEAAVLAGPAGTLAGGAGPRPAVNATAADHAAADPTAADPAAMAALLASHYGAVVVKLGVDGALLATAGAEPARFPAHPAVVRDTTGAGDAFCAGFLVAWLARECDRDGSLPWDADPPGGQLASAEAPGAAAGAAARSGVAWEALAAAMEEGGRAAAIAVSTLGGRPEPQAEHFL